MPSPHPLLTRHALCGLGALLTFALAACAPSPEPDPRPAAEAAIRKLDNDWSTAAQTLNPDAWMAFYSEDATLLPPNEKQPTSRTGIRKTIAELLSLPGLQISWRPAKIEVARSGELAYLYGSYTMSFDGEKGKPRVTDEGKILEVWKKQADGSWKCIVDTYNSDMPAAPPAAK
jgi:uncharacterized protein (TIGR02246 family)